jgi:nucleotide-binding universal stress UspA family protein
MSGNRRRSYEVGHRPKFLVVVDNTEECDRAVYFAARRVSRLGATLMMLSVIDPSDFPNWLGVADVMTAEARSEAEAALERHAAKARSLAGIEPERIVRIGIKANEIVKLIDEDQDVAILVLAAGTGTEGPGPLVSLVASSAASFPIPVAIVPGSLSNEEIDALA